MGNASDFEDMITNFHRGVIPVAGAGSLGILFLVILLVHFKGHRLARFLGALIVLAGLAQAVVGVGLTISMMWSYGVVLSLSSVFAIYAGLSRNPDVLIVNAFVGVFNMLALTGRLSWFSISTPPYTWLDFKDSPLICMSYLGLGETDDDTICYQYLSALRFATYLVIFIVASITFLSYALSKVTHLHETLGHLDEPVVEREGYGYKRDVLY